MKKAKEWADVYMSSEVPVTLEKLIKLVQSEVIDETVKACADAATTKWTHANGTVVDSFSILSVAETLKAKL